MVRVEIEVDTGAGATFGHCHSMLVGWGPEGHNTITLLPSNGQDDKYTDVLKKHWHGLT